jgi:hypothetical protein
MFSCERCGTRFGRHVAGESCPRCLAREGVRVTLTFRLLEEQPPIRTTPRPEEGLEAAVRRGLASASRDSSR